MPPNETGATLVAFASPTSGIGRSGAIANVACVLAVNGLRVLIIDWSGDGGGVRGYLAPFYLDEPESADSPDTFDSANFIARMSSLFGRRQRYWMPAPSARDIDVIGGPGDDQTPVWPVGESELAAAEDGLRRADYDYVLLDTPTEITEDVIAGLARLFDVVVTGFAPRRQQMLRAGELAAELRERAGGDCRIVIAPAQVDDRSGTLASFRSQVRENFEPFLRAASSTETLVEIPYRPYDAYDEVLAVLLDDPGPGTLRHAYERLTRAITHGGVDAMPTVPPAIRARYRRGRMADPGGAGDRAETETVALAYAPDDRPWADWIGFEFETAGVRLVRNAVAAGHAATAGDTATAAGDPATAAGEGGESERPDEIVAICSPALAAAAVVGDIAPSRLVGVRVAKAALGEPTLPDELDLTGLTEVRARALLRRHLRLIPIGSRARPARRIAPGFPGSAARPPETLGLPDRNADFVGRDEELEKVRDLLTADGPLPPVILTGPPGRGKTEIAKEYAHRFAHNYRHICWVPAQTEESVREALTGLAGELAIPPEGDAVEALREALAHGRRNGRVLLVYDDAKDAEAFGALPRPGSAHVIVTTQTAPPTPQASTPQVPSATVPIGEFDAAESVAFLRAQLPELTERQARAVAAEVGHLPFALRLAAAWLAETATTMASGASTQLVNVAWAVDELSNGLQRLRTGSGREFATAGSGLPAGVASCLALARESLAKSERGRLASLVLELCAFLAHDGISLRLLRSEPMLRQVSRALGGDAGAAFDADTIVFDEALWTLQRYGLAELAWEPPAAVRMHRMVRDLVIALMSPELRAERRRQVLEGLAASVPADADNSARDHRETYAELQRHLGPSGALESLDQPVRRLIVNQIRYLHVQDDPALWRSTVVVADQLLKIWTEEFGESDPLRMQLVGHAASLHRDLGQYAEALRLGEELLERYRADLGLLHRRTLMSGQARAASLRGLGRYREARTEDRRAWSGFVSTLGPDHPQSLEALNNLALSSFGAGDQRGALAYATRLHERQAQLLGPLHPMTLWIAGSVGMYRSELGDLDGAYEILEETRQRQATGNPVHRLRTLKALAVTQRRMGDPDDAARRHDEALTGYRERFGDRHPDTLACKLSLAADRHALGDHAAAVRFGAECLADYLRWLGPDHLFTRLCRVNLGVFRLGAGDAAGALEAIRDAHAGLRDQLGEQHPWTMAAALDEAAARVATGDDEGAAELTESTRVDCLDILGGDHPYTRLALTNKQWPGRGSGGGDTGGSGMETVDIDMPRV